MSLRIYGGGLSAGFDASPLVSVGTIPIGYVPMPPIIVDEELSWMISHTQSHTVYHLYSRNCRTTMGEAGQLLACLFLPAQKRLAENASPLGLLNSVFDFFSIHVMQGENLPDVAADPSPFIALLKRYPLEERPLPLPVMGGRGSVAFCVSNLTQLDALMRHSRYPVLSSVGRLELGMHCPSTIQLSTVGNTTNAFEPEQKQETDDMSPKPPLVEVEVPSVQKTTKQLSLGKITLTALVVCTILLLGIVFLTSHDDNQMDQPAIAKEPLAAETVELLIADDSVTKKEQQSEGIDRSRERSEILALVNKKDLTACRQHPGWPHLQADEKAAIEGVLDVKRYKGSLKKKVEKMIEHHIPFKSMSEIRIVQKEIWRYHMEE